MNQIVASSDVNGFGVGLQTGFWAKVSVVGANQCWNWQGTARPKGYGDFRPKSGKYWRAHRLALALHDGRERTAVVRHLCDNPRCCNPNHLAWGTGQENAADRMDVEGGLKLWPLHPRVRAALPQSGRKAVVAAPGPAHDRGGSDHG